MANYSKPLYSLLFILAILLLSCQEGGDAGDLLGQWRKTGSDTQYVSFSGSVTVFRNGKGKQVFGNFQHVGDSLFIQCYSVKGEPSDTAFVENDFGFRPFHDIRLKIQTLDSEHLILSKDNKTWSFTYY